MIQCFDILTGCNSALIRIRLHPDPDPVKIRIRPDPKIWDPVHPYSSVCPSSRLSVCFRPVCDHSDDIKQRPKSSAYLLQAFSFGRNSRLCRQQLDFLFL